MACYAMETDYRTGRRFVPVRETDGELWLQTMFMADTAAEALEAAELSDACELGAEWAAVNRLVGVAEVVLEIVELRPVEVERAR